MKQTKGITLVALVITIIVLIILAGVTMNILIGENGIITKTKEAARLTEKERVKEKVSILLAEYEIKQATESQTLSAFLTEKVGSGEITEIIEETDDAFVIEVEGYEFTISKSTREITNVADTNIKISITYPNGTVGSTAKAVVTVANNKQTVDTSSLVYGWSNSRTVEPASWTSFTSGAELTHAIVGSEIWFLWIKANYIGGEAGTVSQRISSQFNDVDTAIPTISATVTNSGDLSYATVSATVTYGFSGVKRVLWLEGTKTEADFASSGIELTRVNDTHYSFTVTKNMNYTVYIEGNNGNKAVTTKTVTGLAAPAMVNPPEMIAGMTPIKWSGTTEVSTTVDDVSWYGYVAQAGPTTTGGSSRWANAKTSNGSYLVWIPRYSYKITSGEHGSGLSAGQAGTIDIKFSDGLVDDTSNAYTIHPAFTNVGNGGLGELTGFWVGKFENSNDGNGNIKIIPGVQPYNSINVSTIFTKAQAFSTNNSLTGYDSHMIKNSEWGAVAYLAHSQYGRNKTEMSINNHYDGSDNTTFKTGYAGYTISASYTAVERTPEDTTSTSGSFPYNNTYRGVLASTTGNIYGVYDMAGGTLEYVMAVYNNTIGSSGFATLPASKYYDNYPTTYAACSTIKGDAIYETSSNTSTTSGLAWFGEWSEFLTGSEAWMARGGWSRGAGTSGIFTFDNNGGGANGWYSSRLVLTK